MLPSRKGVTPFWHACMSFARLPTRYEWISGDRSGSNFSKRPWQNDTYALPDTHFKRFTGQQTRKTNLLAELTTTTTEPYRSLTLSALSLFWKACRMTFSCSLFGHVFGSMHQKMRWQVRAQRYLTQYEQKDNIVGMIILRSVCKWWRQWVGETEDLDLRRDDLRWELHSSRGILQYISWQWWQNFLWQWQVSERVLLSVYNRVELKLHYENIQLFMLTCTLACKNSKWWTMCPHIEIKLRFLKFWLNLSFHKLE